jgi:thiol-disulfide isomerase/thioredoxin
MTLHPSSFALAVAFALALAGCSKPPDTVPVPKPKTAAVLAAAASLPAPSNTATPVDQEAGIAWQRGDVDAAFAQAKASNKPVFLYWGAGWCPPCNQVKATVFNRQDFIERSRFFVPVYVDGDAPSAQRLGDRFKVSGYPTMILFKPDGEEITRLPGEVDAEQYMRVLAMGMNGARPVTETLAAALRDGTGATLSADDWRMLAYYSWDTDEHRLIAENRLATTLGRLALSCPAEHTAACARLALRTLVAEATAKAAKSAGDKTRTDPVKVRMMMATLADARLARENFDLLVYYADNVTAFITASKSPQRAALVGAWTQALGKIVADESVATADRLGAIEAQVALARMDASNAPLTPATLERVRTEVARADRTTKDPYARQSVISAAADLLAAAGLMDESNALLTTELSRSHSPYYFMSGLADNAKKSGDKAAALDWHEKAYAASDGPATRLQWGARYVVSLVEISPQDANRIERAAISVISDVDVAPDAFYARSGRALARMGRTLSAWDKDRRHDAALARIRARLATTCAQLPAADPSRSACDGVFTSKPRVSG